MFEKPGFPQNRSYEAADYRRNLNIMVRQYVAFFYAASLLAAPAPTVPNPPAPQAAGAPSPAPVVTLDQAINEALDHNLDLLAERYNLSVSDTRMITAKLRPNPVVSLGYIYLPFPGTDFNFRNGVGPTEWNSRVDFLLERGGKRQDRMALAKADRDVAELSLKNTIRGIVYSVQGAFVDVLLAKESVALAEDNLRAFQGIVTINTARVTAGDLAKVELSRTRIAALQFQNAVQQAQLQLTQAKIKLQQLLGRVVPIDAFDIQGDMRREPAMPAVDRLRDVARDLRPDLQGIQAAQAKSQADLKLQIAQGKVDYTVGAQYSYQRVNPGTASTFSLYFAAPLPVFNRNQGEIVRAQRESEQWVARLKAAQNSVDAEVRSAYQQYLTSKNLLDNIETNMVSQAKDVRQITEYSYRRGEASLIEFLDAQRAFNDTMQSYNQARADYARSLYLLDSATGQQTKASQ